MARGFAQSFKAGLLQVDTVQFEDLGVLRYTDNAVFKYVKFSGTTVVLAGDPVGYVITDTTLQTVDPASFLISAGAAMAAMAAGTVQYGWIQIGGINTAVNGNSAAAGTVVAMSASKTLAAKSALTQAEFGVVVVNATPSIIDLCCIN